MAEGPMRTCTGCRKGRARDRMIRVTRAGDGAVRIDPIGSAPGRGAYVCPQKDCVERACRSGSLAKALRSSGPLPEGLREALFAMTKGTDG
jgi:uncharacterized protein